MFKRLVSMFIVMIFIFNSIGVVLAQDKVKKDYEKQFKYEIKHLADGTIVSTAEINDLHITLEEKDNLKKYKLLNKKANKEEIVLVDITKDEFKIIRDGIESTYNRKDYLKESKYFEKPSIDSKLATNNDTTTTTMSTMSTTDSGYPYYLGDSYSNKFLMSKSFTHDSTLKFANLDEDYYWYFTHYKHFFFEAYETVSVIVGVLTIGISNVLTLLSGVIATVSGVNYIIKNINVEQNAYEQQWLKEVRVSGERQYYSARTRVTTYNHVYETQKNVVEEKSDNTHYDFYDNTLIMDKGIDNYIYFNTTY